MAAQKNTRLAEAMRRLGLSAVGLSAEAGISNSLISRWQRGLRPLPATGDAVVRLAGALARLDRGGALDDLLLPYRAEGQSKQAALLAYLTGRDLPGLAAQVVPAPVQRSGEYVAQQRVLLGAKGFRKGALLMLDYLLSLPPGQHLTVCAHGGYELWHGSLPFALAFLQKMGAALKRGTRVTLVSRNAVGLDGSPQFSVYWLVMQLKGIIRSRYYEAEAPPEYFVGCIPGYWSGRTEYDDTAEDGLFSTFFTDERNMRRDVAHCEAFMERSANAAQYGFLRSPGKLRQEDLPRCEIAEGGLSAITRVPGFGVMTRAEWVALCGRDAPPPLPGGLFSYDSGYAPGRYRIILCREDVRVGLAKARRLNEPLSELLQRKVYVPREMLAAQLRRLLAAMAENEAFEVALMPRAAFRKLELELVCWPGGAGIAWLQSMEESLLATDTVTYASFANAVEHVWGRLQKGWKRKKTVQATLRKWLAGKELNAPDTTSRVVEGWEVFPKE